jgi:hypothetical protein
MVGVGFWCGTVDLGLAWPGCFFLPQRAGAPDIGFLLGFKSRVGWVSHDGSPMPKQPRFDRRSGTPGKKPSAPSLRSGRAGCFGGPSRMGERNRSRSGLVILIVETLLKFLPSPGQPRAFRYGVTVVLVAVFFLFSLGAKVAAGPFGFLFLILRLSSKKIMKRLLAGYKAHLERTYTKPTFSGPMADFFA